jgi:predicted DNA-binding protein
MGTQITLTIPDETYQRAEHLAQLTGRNIADVLADTLDISLNAVRKGSFAGKAVAELSDAEVLELADSMMGKQQSARLSILLDKQQAGKLDSADAAELLDLMQHYQDGFLRKAQALKEAVQRGLRKPLEP